MSQNLRDYQGAMYGFDAIVQRTGADQWANATPCEAWTALDLLNHNIRVKQLVALLAQGIDTAVPASGAAGEFPAPHFQGHVATPAIYDPALAIGIDQDPVTEWGRHRDEVFELLDRPGVLERRAKTPWGEVTTDEFLPIETMDLVVHTWDLAVATDQEPIIDGRLVSVATEIVGDPGDGRDLRQPGIVGDAIHASSSDPVHVLLALTGRDGTWTPPN